MALNRVKRSSMSLKVYELKIDSSHVSKTTKAALDSTFVQAKWLFNCMLRDSSFFTRSDKDRSVTVFKFNPETQKCDIPEVRTLTLGSQILQSLIERGKQNIINLSKAKAKGIEVGEINFASEVNSIPLKQFGSTHKFIGGKSLRLQGIGKVKVNGLEQLSKTEPASAVLIKNSLGYFIKIVGYSQKVEVQREGEVGLDFGIKDSIVTSDGEKFNFRFEIPKELKNKQRKLSKKKKGSRNYVKQLQRVKKSYARLTNKKNNAANQFVSGLKKYKKVFFQDENIKGWHAGLFGKQVQQSILGRIKTRLKNLETSQILNRWLPTTKISPLDGSLIKLGLNERSFQHLSFSEDRDIKSAKTILCFGLYNPKLTSTELRSLPIEGIASIFSNYKFESTSISR